MLLWLIGVDVVVGNMAATLVGGGGYDGLGMDDIVGMIGIVGIGKKLLSDGLKLNGGGCMWLAECCC